VQEFLAETDGGDALGCAKLDARGNLSCGDVSSFMGICTPNAAPCP